MQDMIAFAVFGGYGSLFASFSSPKLIPFAASFLETVVFNIRSPWVWHLLCAWRITIVLEDRCCPT